MADRDYALDPRPARAGVGRNVACMTSMALALLTGACGGPADEASIIRLTEPGEPAIWEQCLELPLVDQDVDATADGPPASGVALRVASGIRSASTLAVVECFTDAGLTPGQIQVVPD